MAELRDRLVEAVALSVCEVVAEEGNTPPSCVEYWGPEYRDDWCDACKSVVDLVPLIPVLTGKGKSIAEREDIQRSYHGSENTCNEDSKDTNDGERPDSDRAEESRNQSAGRQGHGQDAQT